VTISVGLGQYVCGKAADETWVIHGIGSCIGLVLADSSARAAAMAHVVLPEVINGDLAHPAKYAETVVPFLIERLMELGASSRALGAYVVGGAQMLTVARLGDIGRRNVETVLESLKENKVRVFEARVGGTIGRTLRWEAARGRAVVSRVGHPDEVLTKPVHEYKEVGEHATGARR